MGANVFFQSAKGKTAQEAFINAREEALYEYGHRGYTGTIAEKHEFVMIPLPKGKTVEDAGEYADQLINEGDERIDSKWGPAGCIDIGSGEFLFFGWASS